MTFRTFWHKKLTTKPIIHFLVLLVEFMLWLEVITTLHVTSSVMLHLAWLALKWCNAIFCLSRKLHGQKISGKNQISQRACHNYYKLFFHLFQFTLIVWCVDQWGAKIYQDFDLYPLLDTLLFLQATPSQERSRKCYIKCGVFCDPLRPSHWELWRWV